MRLVTNGKPYLAFFVFHSILASALFIHLCCVATGQDYAGKEYIYGLQRSVALKKMMERVLDNISD